MATSPRCSSLVESVAHVLTFAINDPVGHNSWSLNHKRDFSSKRRRCSAETHGNATVFDSSAIPPIGIDKYLMRLQSYFQCSDACFIAALILVDRMLGYDGGELPVTKQNVHRLFLACLVVAAKYHEDVVFANNHYAKAGGVQLREVNRLERVLLQALDFDLSIAPEQYRLYEAALLALCDLGPTVQSFNELEGTPPQPLAAEGAVAHPTSAVVPAKAAITIRAAPAVSVTSIAAPITYKYIPPHRRAPAQVTDRRFLR